MTIQEIIADFLIKNSDILNSRIEMKLRPYKKDIMQDMRISEPKVTINGDKIQCELSYGGVALWMVEYGSGSKMDKTSKYFTDYSVSESRIKNNYAFTGHPKGDVVVRPDGTQYVSTGKMKGRNLEHRIGKLEPYIPLEAQHVISQEIDLWAQEIEPELREVVYRNFIEKDLLKNFEVSIL